MSRVRTSVVVIHNEKLLTFRAQDPHSGREYYFLPGGRIEKGESAPDAAAREAMEETGYDIDVDSGSAIDKEYSFHWNDEDYDCLTIFYRGRLKNPFQQPEQVDDASYHLGVHWLPVEEVSMKFLYERNFRGHFGTHCQCWPHPLNPGA